MKDAALSNRGRAATGAARDRRRAELLDAADAVVRRRGPAASMDEIAAEASITKPILYRHFGDKGGLYRALAERYVEALMQELRSALAADPDPYRRLRATVDTYLAFIEREAEAYDFLVRRAAAERPETRRTLAGFVRQVADEVAAVMRGDLPRFGVDPGRAETWAFGIVGMVHLAGDRWMERRDQPRAELVDALCTLIWGGLSSLASAPGPARPRPEG